jgi:hypothetical protein
VKSLIGGEFGGHKFGPGAGASEGQEGEGEGEGEERVQLGRQEIVSIPEHCPSCNALGESLTALTDIPHFKEVTASTPLSSLCLHVSPSLIRIF